MNKSPEKQSPKGAAFATRVGAKVLLKLKARRNDRPGIWIGLGMMGLIGWSIAMPTLMGAALGIWLDKTYPGDLSWTLGLLLAGLTIGCFNAWNWVVKEDLSMKEDGSLKRNPDE